MFRVILLIVLVAVGVVAYNDFQTTGSGPGVAAQQTVVPAPNAVTASPTVKPSPTAVTSSNSAGKPVHMVLTESQITSKVQQMVGSGQAGNLQNVQVKLGDGVATIDGTTSVAGMSVPVEATAKLGASDGLLNVDVMSIKAGNVDLPAPVQDQLIQQVKQSTGLKDLQKIDVGMYVTSVQVQPGQVVLDGHTK